MSVDIATLGLEVRSDGVVIAGKHLRELSLESARTEKNINKMGDASSTLSNNLMKLGAAIGGLAAIKKAFNFSMETIALASDLEETQGKFDVVFKGMSKTAESWSQGLRESYAMSETESKKYLSSIQDLLVPTGMLRTDAGKLSNEFVKMAADLGSFNNRATPEVIRDMQSALQGSTETMAKYGINVKVAKLEQEILNQKWVTSKKDITDAHKAQAIYNIMMREGADAVGDMARTSGSYANQLKRAEANANDFKTSIGNHLLPVATKFLVVLNQWSKVNDAIIGQKMSEYANDIAIGLTYAVDAVIGFKRVFQVAGRVIALVMIEWELNVYKLADAFVNGPIEKLNQMISLYNLIPMLPDIEMFNITETGENIKKNIKTLTAAVAEGVGDIVKILEEPLPGSGLRKELEKINAQAKLSKKELVDTGDIGQSTSIITPQIDVEKLNKEFKKMLSSLRSPIKQLQEELKKIDEFKAAGFFHGVETTAENLKQKLISNFIGLDDIFKTPFSTLQAELKKIDEMDAAKLFDGLEKSAEDVKDKLKKDFFDELEEKFDEPLSFNFADSNLSDMANMITGINNITIAYTEYEKKIKNIADLKKDSAKYIELQQKAESTLIKKQLSGYSNLAGASSKYFEEGSRGRKALHNLEMTFGAAEIAMALAKLAPLAATAILNQGGGEPMSALARMAMMATVVSGIIVAAGGSFSIGLGGGGGNSKTTPSKTSGTALGMGEDVSSESLSKSFEILEEFSSLQYIELKGIYDQVKELNQNLTGVTNSIMRNVGIMPGSTENIAVQGGVQIQEIALKDISESMALEVKDYFEATMGMGDFSFTDSQERKTAEDTSILISKLYVETKDAIMKYADLLGLPKDKIAEYTIAMQTVDVSGLNAEDAAKKWEDWHSTMMDTIFSDLFSGDIVKYQDASEGLTETATRLASGLKLTDIAAKNTGIAFSSIGAQAIEASESLIDSAGGLKDFSELINEFYDDFTSKGDQLRNTNLLLQDSFEKLNIGIPKSKDEFKNLVASLDLADENSHKLYLDLMNLAPSFAAVAESSEEYQEKLNGMKEWYSGFGPELTGISKQFKSVEKDMESFRKEIEDTGNTIPEGWEKGGAVEKAVKDWVKSMEKYSISLDISSDMFSLVADAQTKLDYEHWQRLQQINELTTATGERYPDLIASANELYDLRTKQLDEEINTVWELKSFYDGLAKRIVSLRESVEKQADTFKTKDQVAGTFAQLNQQITELDPTSQDFLEKSTELLEQIWETGNELYGMEDKSMQELLEVQKEQLQAQIDTLNTQKESIEKQIGTLKQIETFLFDLSGGSLAPVQSSEGMMAQYDKLLAEAQKSGDISELESFIKGGFFEFFKAYGNYKDINAMVVNDIMSLGDDISGGATLDDLEAQLKTLNGTIESMSANLSNMKAPESIVNGMNLEDWTKSLLPRISSAEGQINTTIDGLDSEISLLSANMLTLIQSIDTWGENLKAEDTMFDNQILIDAQTRLTDSINQLNNTVSYAFMDQLPVEQIVNSAYQNLFGRAPNESGLDWWTEQLESGTIAMSNFKDTLIASAGSNDLKYYTENNQNRAQSSGDNAQSIALAVSNAIAGTGVNADVHVYIDEKEIKDVMVKVTRKDNQYQQEIKRAVKVA